MGSASFVPEWLHRSGSLPLYLQCTVEKPNEMTFYFARNVLASLMLHARRWQVLDLAVPAKFLDWMTEFLSHKPLQRLEYLKTNFESVEDEDLHVLQLHASPRLITQGSASVAQVSLNWTTLRTSSRQVAT